MIRHNSVAGNRAASALFRVFGGAGSRVIADAYEPTADVPMHAGERRFLAIIVPLTVAVAVWDGLFSAWGAIAAALLILPATLVLLHLLPFLLVSGSPIWQWRMWLGAFGVWAWFHHDTSGPAQWCAWLWLGIATLNLSATLILGLRKSMDWQGITGVIWRLSLFIGLHGVAIMVGMKFGWSWALLCGAAIAAVICLAIFRPNACWLGEITSEADDFLITLDDGPDPDTTPALLDLLDVYQTKALFFLIGEKAKLHPKLVREIVRRGHEIGNHTLSHPQASFWCAGPWRTWREISGGQKAIMEAGAQSPTWFRAPVGHRNLFTHPLAAMLGLRVMGWSRRGYDAVEKDAAKVLERILPDLRRGDIILLHEATPIAAEVLEPVLMAIQSAMARK